MIKRFLFDWLCKEYIEEEVDRRFKENMVERYFATRIRELSERTKELRKKVGAKTAYDSDIGSQEGKILLSSKLRRDNSKSELQTKKAGSADALKAKLNSMKGK